MIQRKITTTTTTSASREPLCRGLVGLTLNLVCSFFSFLLFCFHEFFDSLKSWLGSYYFLLRAFWADPIPLASAPPPSTVSCLPSCPRNHLSSTPLASHEFHLRRPASLCRFGVRRNNLLSSETREATQGWALVDGERGHLVWRHLGRGQQDTTKGDGSFDPRVNVNAGDMYARELLRQKYTKRTAHEKDEEQKQNAPSCCPVANSLNTGISYWLQCQSNDGGWVGDYGGPHFLIPGFVFGCYVCGHALEPAVNKGLMMYVMNHQQEDGGWGLHIEGGSTMMCTSLYYVTLRLLGLDKDDLCVLRAKTFITRHGGVWASPLWAKVWLSVVGVYEWSGVSPILPEPYLLPVALTPWHPGRMWCHSRMVHLPMCYLYATKFVGHITPLIKEIREELYPCTYSDFDWDWARTCPTASTDSYQPTTRLARVLFNLMHYYDKYLACGATDCTISCLGTAVPTLELEPRD
eukprot:GHVS01072284.1.p1 GENE.GHVS01072284.1~~GHVS01072284.1.p1  ORF type:complete len:464 (-),score=39.70 GHVS01072284.1:552-1943(-)